MRSNVFRTIKHFLASILIIIVLEILTRALIEGLLLPKIWKAYGMTLPDHWGLGRLQMLSVNSSSMLIILLWIFMLIVPGAVKPLVNYSGLWVEELVRSYVPELSGRLWTNDLPPATALWLFVLTLFGLLLQILPYLLAAIYFSMYVVRENRRALQEKEQERIVLEMERNRMLSSIAHDIRNPLTTISGYARALEDGMVKDPLRQMEYLDAICKKTERVEELISILFEYTKLNSAGYQLNLSKVDLSEFLRRQAAALYTDAETAEMELVPEISPVSSYHMLDAMQFSRVIYNLITNALRYNPKGTKILIRYESDEGSFMDDVLTIADTGLAIDPDTADTLFEPFSRGDAARLTDGGSGLGLSIVKSVIDHHGYKISYHTDIPGYTKGFIINIPKKAK